MTIINPFKITREELPPPDVNTLKKLINETYEEIGSIMNNIRHNRKNPPYRYFDDFLVDSLKINSEILMAISKLSHNFLNETMILMRTFLETLVDFLWLYSIYHDDSEKGEELAKRFYRLGANIFLQFSDNFKKIAKNDPFLRKSNIDFDKQIKSANEVKLIQTYNEKATKYLQNLQKNDWRAHPNYFTNKKEINFFERSKVASKIAKKLFNLKDAPYYKNWNILNKFTHWTSFHYKFIDEEISSVLYQRNLNIYLGFIHDMISVICKYFNLPITSKIREIRAQFVYFST